MRLYSRNNLSLKLPLDPADRYYEAAVYKRLATSDSLFVFWLSRFLLHFVKGVCMGTGMYWTLHALKLRVGPSVSN
jgi:hypothetical protein